MPIKNSYITVTDQFCGAGGSSQGAVKAGAEVKLALNHWKLAIETHNTNFPNTLHDCTDISACDPRRYPTTDILITSPECTNHSLAKGQKQVQKQIDMFDQGKLDPAAERSRATMWDVCRFAEYHKYNVIIVENVVDARKWIMWEAWLQAMHLLGYMHKCVYLNSMHCHPTPQSRDRMYIVFWKKGNKAPLLDYTPLAHCPRCEKNVHAVQTWKHSKKQFGKYKQQYVYCCPNDGTIVEPYYYAAFNCIDWSDFGTRIGDRKKPLSPNTERRVKYGLKKYGSEPMLMHSLYGPEARGVVRPLTKSAFTQTTLPTQAIVHPYIINDQHSTGVECRVKSAQETIGTIPTASHYKMVFPFVVKGEHTLLDGYAKSTTETMQTQTVRQSMGIVTPPFIVENKKTSNAREITSPLACATTVPYHGIISTDKFNSFISYYYGSNQSTNQTEPLGAATTKERYMMVNYKQPEYEDCYYRMLKPNEIKLAMAFNNDYVVLGSGKHQVKQLGNAVTPPAMEWLMNRAIESLS
jgi:DNA (cytosine-5)-methyltransferase 1